MTTGSSGGGSARERAKELAFADALVSIGRALTLLGTRLSDINSDEDAGQQTAEAIKRTTTGADIPRGGLGPRQLAVLGLGGFSTEGGLSAAQVEAATAMSRPNVHKTLRRLTELGHLESLAEERPTRWVRAQPAHR